MAIARSLLFGLVLIALSILLTNGTGRALASARGPYQLMNHSNTTSNVGIFRMDTNSGEVSYCYLTGNASLTCTPYVK